MGAGGPRRKKTESVVRRQYQYRGGHIIVVVDDGFYLEKNPLPSRWSTIFGRRLFIFIRFRRGRASFQTERFEISRKFKKNPGKISIMRKKLENGMWKKKKEIADAAAECVVNVVRVNRSDKDYDLRAVKCRLNIPISHTGNKLLLIRIFFFFLAFKTKIIFKINGFQQMRTSTDFAVDLNFFFFFF